MAAAGRLDHPRLQRLRLVLRLHLAVVQHRQLLGREHPLPADPAASRDHGALQRREVRRQGRRLPGQATSAVCRAPQYVTILIGANDACTGTEAAMTAVGDFRAQLDAALATLKAGLPNADSLRPQHSRHQATLGGRQGQRLRPHGLVAVRHLPVDAGQPDLHRPPPTSPAATGYASGSSTSTPSSPRPAPPTAPTALRRQRRLQLPVHPSARSAAGTTSTPTPRARRCWPP